MNEWPRAGNGSWLLHVQKPAIHIWYWNLIGLPGLRGLGLLFHRISSFIKPQTSQSEHKETPRIKIALYTQLGVGVASKYSDSTICFGQGSASYVTNKVCYDEVRGYLPKGLEIQSASKTPCFPKLEINDRDNAQIFKHIPPKKAHNPQARTSCVLFSRLWNGFWWGGQEGISKKK